MNLLFQCQVNDVTKCRFCEVQFVNLFKKSKHFSSHKACKRKLIQLARRIKPSQTEESKVSDKRKAKEYNPNKIVIRIICSSCKEIFKGKASFFHHKVFNFIMDRYTYVFFECYII